MIKVSSFYRSKSLHPVLKYSLGALCLTVLLMLIAMPALVYPSYENRNSIPMHNILMAAASVAISSFQLAFVLFMWTIGEKLVNLIQEDRQEEIIEVKQRVSSISNKRRRGKPRGTK